MVSSSSSSSFKKSHKTRRTISLNSLPNELLVEISACVAATSLSEFRNLQLVSKPFQRFCNDGYVFHRLPLHQIPLFPWHQHNREKFSRFFKTCLNNGNPEALYRKGLIDCFHLDWDEQSYRGIRRRIRRGIRRGIRYVAKAARQENQEAQYVYGMILICLGGRFKQKGFKILSSLIKPLMSSTIKEIAQLRQNIRDHILWRGQRLMRQLKRGYVRENCNCDGRTEIFLAKNCGFDEEDIDMATSSSSLCEICLWHHEVQLFL